MRFIKPMQWAFFVLLAAVLLGGIYLAFTGWKQPEIAQRVSTKWGISDSGIIDFTYETKLPDNPIMQKSGTVAPEVYATGRFAISSATGQFLTVELIKLVGEVEQGQLVERIDLKENLRFILVLDNHGVVKGLRPLSKVTRIITNIVADTFSAIQIAIPVESSVSHWEVSEEDLSGLYRAEYHKEFDPVSMFLDRVKWRKVVREQSDENGIQRDTVADIYANFGDGPTFEWKIESKIRMAHLPIGALDIRRFIQASFKKDKALLYVVPQEAAKSAIASVKESGLVEPSGNDALDRKMLINSLGSVQWADIFSELQKLDMDGEVFDAVRSGNLVEKMYAYLHLNPEMVSEYEKILLDPNTRPESFRYVVGALYQVGTSECQKVLIDALNNSILKHGQKLTVIAGLGLTERPSAASIEALRGATEGSNRSLASASYLSLGSMASRQNDSETQNRILEYLKNRLDEAKATEDEKVLLGALGNTNHRSVLEILLKSEKIEREEFRKNAISSLKFVKTKEVEDFVVGELANGSESIRFEAAKVLEGRTISVNAITVILEGYKKELSAPVRASLVRGIWNNRKDYPSAIAFIQKVRDDDTSLEVRKLARTLLVGYE